MTNERVTIDRTRCPGRWPRQARRGIEQLGHIGPWFGAATAPGNRQLVAEGEQVRPGARPGRLPSVGTSPATTPAAIPYLADGPGQATSCSRRRLGRAFLQSVDVERARGQQAETLLAAGQSGPEEDNASPCHPVQSQRSPRRGPHDQAVPDAEALPADRSPGRGDGWYVRDLRRAATGLGHQAEAIDICRVRPRSLSS